MSSVFSGSWLILNSNHDECRCIKDKCRDEKGREERREDKDEQKYDIILKRIINREITMANADVAVVHISASVTIFREV